MCQKEDKIRKILQRPTKLGKVTLRKGHKKGQNGIQPLETEFTLENFSEMC